MSEFREYRWSSLSQRQAQACGVPRKKAREMARLSAPFTHPKWNRRFEDWVMIIEGDLVLEFAVVQEAEAKAKPKEPKRQTRVSIATWARHCTICHGTLRMTYMNDHEACGGEGCEGCKDGQVREERRCPVNRKTKQLVCSDVLNHKEVI